MSVTVPCMYCGTLTEMIGTQKCDNCWEVSTRIRNMPEIVVRRIIAEWEARLKTVSNSNGDIK